MLICEKVTLFDKVNKIETYSPTLTFSNTKWRSAHTYVSYWPEMLCFYWELKETLNIIVLSFGGADSFLLIFLSAITTLSLSCLHQHLQKLETQKLLFVG